jgi:cytoskeletal protein CcmA (bactofilin family)
MHRSTQSDEAHILGRTVKVRGRVAGEGDLRIEGTVEGDVRVSGELTIGNSGVVTGQANARAVVIEGNLDGDVLASGEVSIRAGARVSGNMNGASVALEEGASFEGRIEAEFDLPDDMTGSGETGTRAPQGGRRGGRR